MARSIFTVLSYTPRRLAQKRARALYAMCSVAAVGVAVMLFARAIPPTASFEPEQGTQSEGITSKIDVSASNGSAVSFASCSIPEPTSAAGYESLLKSVIAGKWYRADAGHSVKLPNGKVLWVFGDTIIGASGQTKGTQFVNNTALLTDRGCITPLVGQKADTSPQSWILPNATTDTPGVDDYYWCSTPFMDDTTLRIFLLHIQNISGGFSVIGTDLASFDISSGTPQLTSVTKTPGAVASPTAPLWGAAVGEDATYTYIYGSINKQETWVFGSYYYIARAPKGQVDNNAVWSYWNGSAWVTDQSQVTSIIPGTAGLGTDSTFFIGQDGKPTLISKKYDSFGTDLVAWKAPVNSFTGPWTEQTPALMAPIPVTPAFTSQDISYLGMAHPWANLSSGKLMVGWSRNSNDLAFFGDIRYGIYLGEVNKL